MLIRRPQMGSFLQCGLLLLSRSNLSCSSLFDGMTFCISPDAGSVAFELKILIELSRVLRRA
jgi:hypothetical protein